MNLAFKKSDLSIVPRWTDNIKDEWINPFIEQSCELNFRDTVSTTLYDAIASAVQSILAGTQGTEWASASTYANNAIVVYNSIYYKANGAIAAAQPAPDVNSSWVKNELLTFWAQFMKPYLVYACYKSFLLWHGKHIAQGGIRKHVDNTSFEVSTDELSFLMGDLRLIIGTKQTKMMNKLNEVNYTFDAVVYATNENVNQVNQGTIIFDV
jgi:hypothetical protein